MLEQEQVAMKHPRASRNRDDDDIAALEDMGADEFIQLKEEDEEVPQIGLEQQSTNAKTIALKHLHLQLYLTASDVEKSYWMSKIFALVLPPQYASFKLYKAYLNTMALSLAYQFHDAYTFESIIDDFNDNFADTVDASTDVSEAVAEYAVYSKWSNLAMIKWQLFMLSIYEQSMASTGSAAAASFLETEVNAETESEAEFFGAGNGNAMMMQYAYMSYYVMMLKYSSLYSELMLAQTGLSCAAMKYNEIKGESASEQLSVQIDQLEGTTLPSMYVQWAQTNQMKYMLEYYTLMMDMQSPAYAASQAVQRAENTFLNLFQTQKAETTATASN